MPDTDDTPPAQVEPKSSDSRLPLPSDNPATNLLIADILVRGAANLLHKQVEEKVAKASADTPAEAEQVIDGRSMLTALGLYGANKLATRSVPGLAIVAGGLIVKALYDRGKSRQERIEREKRTENEE